ncbi:cysteine protease PalB [Trichodelitschia bisporula]|uniref:Cysteine protease PalB n=1 Tax=Trichodelitschia bisporula TaxID=703511 RepID=A0A6G1HVB9_9PEZI|nr:cysteine protease PalB [Trichodelitschia bisporula]
MSSSQATTGSAPDLDALRLQFQELKTRLDSATSQGEAVNIAVQAAQVCISALSIATDKGEKTGFRDQCTSMLDEAARIKKSTTWKPNYGRTDRPLRTVKSSVASSVKLAESGPVSNRELSRAEQIILLRSSKLHGLQFPPWKEVPRPAEFELPHNRDLYSDPKVLRLSEQQLKSFVGWKRAKHALPPPSLQVEGSVAPLPTMEAVNVIGLVQDAASDCSFVASLCAEAARTARGYDKILGNTIYPYDTEKNIPKMSPNGKYVVRLNFNGCDRKVVIDDTLPVSSSRILHVIDRNNPTLLWPALLEKAYLKVRGGYDFPGSNSGTDLWILTGWIPEQIFLQDDLTDPAAIWQRMLNAFGYGDVLITVGTGQMSHSLERELGLAGKHDYAVIDLQEDGDHKWIQLKNPWCEGTGWKGNSVKKGDDKVDPDSEEWPLPASAKKDASTFWIDWSSLLQYFESIYLNWNPALFKHRQDIHFLWDLTGRRSATGSFSKNPQFSLTSKKGGVIWLLLCRHFVEEDDQGASSNSGGHISLYVFNAQGKRIYVTDNHLQRGPYVDSPQTLLRLDVPRESVYTVVASEQGLPSGKHPFTLAAYGVHPVFLQDAPSRFPFSTSTDSAWITSTAGGSQRATFSKNPQFSLTIPAETTIALLLETVHPDYHVHLHLAHGAGKRIVELANRDIIKSSGEYRRGSAFAEIVNLNPGTYTIICSTHEAGQLATFTLRVDSTVETLVKELMPENSGKIPQYLRPACFGPQIKKMAAPMVVWRFTSINLIANFENPAAISARSPIVLSIVLGAGPEQRTVAVSGNGVHSDSEHGVRLGPVDLWPAMRTRSDLYLVIDRLTGVEMPTVERFWLEAWCEGNPSELLEIGAWRDWE